MSVTTDLVHLWLPSSSGSERTFLLLHGTGGNEHDLVPLARSLGVDANILSPRGNVLENGMPRFFRRIAEGVLDVEDLKARANELADFVAAASLKYGFDARQVTAIGYSNGANVALGMLFERPGTLRSAALVRAMFAYEPARVPALGGTDVLLLAGTRDPYSRRVTTDRLATLLRIGGAVVTTSYQEAGHELTQADVDALGTWVASSA